jgi:DNA-binding CsgD family transcriptional regulator
MNNVNSLKARQLQAVKLLALGTPVNQVAERLEISVMTIYRWKQLPQFDAKLNAITSSGLEELARQMNAAALTAVENLQSILCDLSLPRPERIKASLGVLNAMAAVNGALERSIRHGVADFDPQQRWHGQGCTYEATGQSCDGSGKQTIRI